MEKTFTVELRRTKPYDTHRQKEFNMIIHTVVVVDKSGDLHEENLFALENDALKRYTEYITKPHVYNDADVFKVSYGIIELK